MFVIDRFWQFAKTIAGLWRGLHRILGAVDVAGGRIQAGQMA
jgi:hypothetical protein